MFNKNLATKFLLILLSSSIEAIQNQSFRTQSYPSCFTEGTTWSDAFIDVVLQIPSVYSCQDLCLQSPNCRHFTYYDEMTVDYLTCFLFGSTTTEVPCTGCVSGPQSCDCSTPKPPQHGAWFCPPSTDPSTCHLECDPGYVSSNKTVITCVLGEWSSAPSCVAAVALITGGSPSFNAVEIYSDHLQKNLPDLPDDRVFHSLGVVNSLALLCGGWYTKTSCLALTSSQHWTHHSNTIMNRFHHSSVSMLGQLHLLGGVDSPYSTEYLAPPSPQWHPSWDLLQDSKGGACSTKVGPELLVKTGGGGGDYPGSVVAYNVTSGAATRLQDLITERWNHGCVFMKDPARVVLVVGGYNNRFGHDEFLGSTEMYDLAAGEWTAVGDLTESRAALKVVVLGDSVLAMGGSVNGRDDSAVVDRFNSTSLRWSPAGDMLQERSFHAVTGVSPSLLGIGHE